MVGTILKDLAIFWGLYYDTSFALTGVAKTQKRQVQKMEDNGVRRVKHTSMYVSENTAESNLEGAVIVHDVIKSNSAEKINPNLNELDLVEIQKEREKLGSKLPLEFCQEIKLEISKGFSASQIAQIHQGKRGYSLRNIKAVSAAIRRANSIE